VWKDVAEEGSALAKGLEKVARADRSFDVREFLEGAKMAYEMIVTAFAQGDRKVLKPLLSRDVYEGFAEPLPSVRSPTRPSRPRSSASTRPRSWQRTCKAGGPASPSSS
jgi:predicted lipid-binding transport protein (Tim44 family)